MKKILKLLVLTISILMVSVPVFATDVSSMYYSPEMDYVFGAYTTPKEITVQLNGEYVDFADANGNIVNPQMINNRTMVPMRKIFEVLGADIQWIQETRSIKATTEELEIGLQIDNQLATLTNKSGEVTEITLDAAPTIRDNRTLVPVRFIAESLDKKVGWDSYNRTVIIIDTSFVNETLKEKTPNFYEYLTADYEVLKTYEMAMELEGKLTYKDTETRSNNTSLNLVGDMDLKLSDTAMYIGLDANITGKGILVEEIKAEGLQKIDAGLILDFENATMYVSSSLIEGFEDKWIKYELSEDEVTEMNAILEMMEQQSNNGSQSFANLLVQEDSLTIYSYETLQATVEMITTMMKDEYFKVSGRTNKTYTYEIELTDLLESLLKTEGYELTEEELKEVTDMMDLKMEFEVKVENNVAKKSSCSFTFEIEEGTETINLEFVAEGAIKNYNEDVEIEIPTGKDVVTADEYATAAYEME